MNSVLFSPSSPFFSLSCSHPMLIRLSCVRDCSFVWLCAQVVVYFCQLTIIFHIDSVEQSIVKHNTVKRQHNTIEVIWCDAVVIKSFFRFLSRLPQRYDKINTTVADTQINKNHILPLKANKHMRSIKSELFPFFKFIKISAMPFHTHCSLSSDGICMLCVCVCTLLFLFSILGFSLHGPCELNCLNGITIAWENRVCWQRNWSESLR